MLHKWILSQPRGWIVEENTADRLLQLHSKDRPWLYPGKGPNLLVRRHWRWWSQEWPVWVRHSCEQMVPFAIQGADSTPKIWRERSILWRQTVLLRRLPEEIWKLLQRPILLRFAKTRMDRCLAQAKWRWTMPTNRPHCRPLGRQDLRLRRLWWQKEIRRLVQMLHQKLKVQVERNRNWRCLTIK